jgi:hypothetical protein
MPRYAVVASDAAEYGFGPGGVDFLACAGFPPGCGAMVTNPPHGDGGAERRAASASSAMPRFVRHALALTRRAEGQLALLVRLQWIAGMRAAALISDAPLRTVLVLTRRIRWLETGGRTNSGQHHHAWIVFDAAAGGDPREPPRVVFAG